MHRLLEQVCDVFDYLVDLFTGLLFEVVASALTVFDDLLALGLDLFASRFETVFGGRLGLFPRGFADLLGLIASLRDAVFAVLFGLCDDLVGLLLGSCILSRTSGRGIL